MKYTIIYLFIYFLKETTVIELLRIEDRWVLVCFSVRAASMLKNMVEKQAYVLLMNEMELSTLIIIVPIKLLASVFLFFNHHTDKKILFVCLLSCLLFFFFTKGANNGSI